MNKASMTLHNLINSILRAFLLASPFSELCVAALDHVEPRFQGWLRGLQRRVPVGLISRKPEITRPKNGELETSDLIKRVHSKARHFI